MKTFVINCSRDMRTGDPSYPITSTEYYEYPKPIREKKEDGEYIYAVCKTYQDAMDFIKNLSLNWPKTITLDDKNRIIETKNVGDYLEVRTSAPADPDARNLDLN